MWQQVAGTKRWKLGIVDCLQKSLGRMFEKWM
jgi:hypothetical protein